jgi:hypothetical protein
MNNVLLIKGLLDICAVMILTFIHTTTVVSSIAFGYLFISIVASYMLCLDRSNKNG